MTGAILWLTGLPGAGKTTLARALVERLAETRQVEMLDGDEVRTSLSADLGYSRADRDTNVHRIAYVARLLAKHGVLAIVSVIAPYAETRTAVKRLSLDVGHPFLEVYVNAPLETVIARDTKGLYKRAHAGEIPRFTGVSDPYETPVQPDLELHTDRETPAESVQRLIDLLEALGLA